MDKTGPEEFVATGISWSKSWAVVSSCV